MNALIGAAGQMSDKDKQKFYDRVCVDGEVILAAFKTKRDSYVFTERRFMYENVQGLTGRKRSLRSVPYSKISAFEVESAGFLDTDGELKLWISGYPGAMEFEFRGGIDVYLIQALLVSQIQKEGSEHNVEVSQR